MTTLLSPSSPKTLHPILHSQKSNPENDNKKIRTASGETGTKIVVKPLKLEDEHENEKVVYTNGFFSFIASPHRKGMLPFQTHTTSNRSNLDVARDKKRILEICYQTPNPIRTEEPIDPPTVVEKATTDPVEQIKEKKSKKKKKSSKQDGKKKAKETKKADPSDSSSNIDTQETKSQQMEKAPKAETTTSQETIKSIPKSISNTQDANEKEGSPEEKGTFTNPPEGNEKRKKKKKKPVAKRDKAGKVVRKRKKSKGRGRVVRPDCFRKGKDAKIGLATINEGFYDGLEANDSDDESSRLTYDSWDCDEIWCTDPDTPSPPNSSDGESGSSLGEDGEGGKNDSVQVKKVQKGIASEVANLGKEVNKPSVLRRIISKKRVNSSLSNDVSSSRAESVFFPRNRASEALNLTNTTVRSNHSDPNADVPLTVMQTDSSEDSESSEESIESTCCTSTASARDDDSTDGKCNFCCFRNKWTIMITGIVFVIAVAAATVGVTYLLDNFEDDEGESSPLFAPTIAPMVNPRPNLRPSQKPSPNIIAIPTPDSILTTLSTSCYMPDVTPGTIIVQAEDAPVINFAPIKSSSSGYCGDGYAALLPKLKAGFKFWSLEVDSYGYYSVAIRYNNVDKGKTSLGLIINDLDKGTFDLSHTENESSWLVMTINNVLLHEGENSIRISVLDSDQEKGPNVDWLAVVLQKPLSKFDYLSGLVAEASGITSQTLLQTRTLQWMANEDTIDYSDVTDVEIIERYALLQLYHYTAGDMWTTTDEWRSGSHACDWYGISCSTDMVVIDLILGTSSNLKYAQPKNCQNLINSLFETIVY